MTTPLGDSNLVPRNVFAQRLGDSWTELANQLGIPDHERRRWSRGEEADSIWAWLEGRDGLARLPRALQAIRRGDLAGLLGQEALAMSRWLYYTTMNPAELVGGEFFGREALLERVRASMRQGNQMVSALTALNAQGGIGKTRLAAEYVVRYAREDFPGGVFWLTGDGDADTQFAALLHMLNPNAPTLAELNQQGVRVGDLLAQTINRLNPGERKLWVVDNFPEPESGQPPELEAWRLGGLQNTNVLLTSRVHIRHKSVDAIEVTPLDEAAAIQMLFGGAERTEAEVAFAQRIVHEVGCLPLALEILAYELQDSPLAEVAQRLSAGRADAQLDEIMDDLRESVSDASLRGIAETFLLSYERLDEDSKRLARIFACFGPAPIPRTLAQRLPSPPNDRNTLRRLQQRHWLTGGDAERHVGSMHRLLASFLRGMSTSDLHDELLIAREALSAEFDALRDDGISRAVEPSIPHADAWVTLFFEHQSNHNTSEHIQANLSLCNTLALYFFRAANYRLARGLQERVLKVRCRVLGEEHPDTLSSMGSLAGTLRSMGKFPEARALQEYVLEARRYMLGEEHPDTLTSINNLALTLCNMGERQCVRELQEYVLEARRRMLGEEHPNTLTTMNNLAGTLWNMGELQKACRLQERVLEARRRVLGEEHPDTLISINNLAGILWNMGEWQGARSLLDHALEANHRVLGEDHPNTLISMNNLASVLWSIGDLQGARALEERVWEANHRVLGEDHPNTLISMGNLAGTLRSMGELQEARELEERVLEAHRRVLGEEHPNTLSSMNNLASMLKSMGEFQEARGLQKRVLEARRRVLGEEHPDTLISMGNLASMLRSMGEFQEARALQEHVLEAHRRVLGEEHPDTLISINSLLSTLKSMGELQQACRLQKRVLEARRRVLGEDHPDTLTSMNNLASTLKSMGELQGARELFERVWEVRRRTLGEEHPDILSSMNNLASTKWEMGDRISALRDMEHLHVICERTLPPNHELRAAVRNALTQMRSALSEM